MASILFGRLDTGSIRHIHAHPDPLYYNFEHFEQSNLILCGSHSDLCSSYWSPR